MAHNKTRTQYDIMHPLFNSLAESDLSSSERLLMIALFRYVDGSGSCYPSYKELIKSTALSDRTISSNIKKLVDKGWITYEQGNKADQQANTYHLNLKRLGVEQEAPKVVPFNGYIAADGSRWSCASEYFASRQMDLLDSKKTK